VKITEQEVRYVAGLANLKLTDAEVARFQADLDGHPRTHRQAQRDRYQ